MTKEEAVKKVWDLVCKNNVEDLREAERIAFENDVFMEFDPEYVAVEDDVFYLNR